MGASSDAPLFLRLALRNALSQIFEAIDAADTLSLHHVTFDGTVVVFKFAPSVPDDQSDVEDFFAQEARETAAREGHRPRAKKAG